MQPEAFSEGHWLCRVENYMEAHCLNLMTVLPLPWTLVQVQSLVLVDKQC